MTIEELYLNCANLTSESNFKVINYFGNKTIYDGKGDDIPDHIFQLDVETFRISESTNPVGRFNVRIIIVD